MPYKVVPEIHWADTQTLFPSEMEMVYGDVILLEQD
jgi:hypothetical protein